MKNHMTAQKTKNLKLFTIPLKEFVLNYLIIQQITFATRSWLMKPPRLLINFPMRLSQVRKQTLFLKSWILNLLLIFLDSDQSFMDRSIKKTKGPRKEQLLDVV